MTNEEIAAELGQAARNLEPIRAFSARDEAFSIETAYDIQWLLVSARLGDGEQLAGVKIGLTSLAKQRQLGLDAPVYGWLTDRMLKRSPASIRLVEHIHPRVEPEIGFVLGTALDKPVTVDEVLALTSEVFCAFEVVDSRYQDFKFGMADVVADNTSAAAVVMGQQVSTAGLDLAAICCSLKVNGMEVASATGDAVLGHPAAAVGWVSGRLALVGRPLPAGSIVLSGGLTDFVPLTAGDVVEAIFSDLGSVVARAL